MAMRGGWRRPPNFGRRAFIVKRRTREAGSHHRARWSAWKSQAYRMNATDATLVMVTRRGAAGEEWAVFRGGRRLTVDELAQLVRREGEADG